HAGTGGLTGGTSASADNCGKPICSACSVTASCDAFGRGREEARDREQVKAQGVLPMTSPASLKALSVMSAMKAGCSWRPAAAFVPSIKKRLNFFFKLCDPEIPEGAVRERYIAIHAEIEYFCRVSTIGYRIVGFI